MGNLAVVRQDHQQAVAVPDSVIEDYLNSLGNKLTPRHRNQFVQIARAFNLNPFIREIYGIPYGDNFNIIVGYEVYLKRAENSGMLTGWRAWTEGEGNNLKGCVEINRKDWEKPFYHEVYFEEYDQKNSMWRTKGRTMIKKVAIAQGFRMAFPVELGGLPYTSDEIVIQGENVNVSTGEITNASPQKQRQSKPPVSTPQSKPATDNGDKATEGQVKMLHVKIRQANITEAAFVAHYNIASVADLPKSMVNAAIKAIGDGEISTVIDAEPDDSKPETVPCKNCGEQINPVTNTGHLLDCPYAAA